MGVAETGRLSSRPHRINWVETGLYKNVMLELHPAAQFQNKVLCERQTWILLYNFVCYFVHYFVRSIWVGEMAMKVYMKLVAEISAAALAALILLKIVLDGRSRRARNLVEREEPCWTR